MLQPTGGGTCGVHKDDFSKGGLVVHYVKIFGPSHSRYVPPVSRAPASELVLQRGGMASDIQWVKYR